MLLLVVRVDDHLHDGTSALSAEIDSFLQGQFHIGTVESKQLHIMGARLQQYPSRCVTLNAKEKLVAVKLLTVKRIRKGIGDGDATPSKLSAHRSLIGELLE